MPLDYSKWDHIEISDDEDDTHPNIDTPSLFKWRHEARLQRDAERKQKKDLLAKEHSQNLGKRQSLEERLAAVKDKDSDEYKKLMKEADDLKKQEEEFKKKEEELKKEEALAPHNVDTLSKEVQSKTVINKPKPPPAPVSEDEKVDRQLEFGKKYKKLVEEFGMYRRYEDSQAFIEKHPQLASEEAANVLAIRCIELQAEGKSELMKHVSHQTIVLQFILELAKQLNVDPRSCVSAFFKRIQLGEKQYMDAFNAELSSFRDRVVERANVRLENARKLVEEEEREEREARLGPGGLDPQEVMESLPEEMQKCFESRDVGMLQRVVDAMPQAEAAYHIKRCVESGLWVPGGAEGEEEEPLEAQGVVDSSANGDTAEDKELYEEVGDIPEKAASKVATKGSVQASDDQAS